jgi:uncharacterized surface protein with fasciclin (FAS1) repeats
LPTALLNFLTLPDIFTHFSRGLDGGFTAPCLFSDHVGHQANDFSVNREWRILNMLRKNVAAMLCLGVLALSANTAQATGGSNYVNCLKTPLVHFDGTIADAAEKTPALKILYELVLQAGLGEALSDPNAELTVYAPTNKAFLAIPENIREDIKADNNLLTAVLIYHVTPGEVDPRRALIPREVKTLQGQTVFFNRGKDGPQINQSNIVDTENKPSCSGVRASNGIVWIINSVLQPQYF